MSIDPAINTSAHLTEVLSLSQLQIMPSAVYLFDFDGVISTRLEDDIYRLPPSDDEIELIASAARHFRIHCAGMEQRYQRHLLYQTAAWFLNLPIEPGPALQKAKDAARLSKLFVLTARSGWHAVQRLRDFLSSRQVSPTEIYNVGRVKKDRQIDLLCREFRSKSVFFVEDSEAHLADAAALAAQNLRLVRVEEGQQVMIDEVGLRNLFRRTLEAAILKTSTGTPDADRPNFPP